MKSESAMRILLRKIICYQRYLHNTIWMFDWFSFIFVLHFLSHENHLRFERKKFLSNHHLLEIIFPFKFSEVFFIFLIFFLFGLSFANRAKIFLLSSPRSEVHFSFFFCLFICCFFFRSLFFLSHLKFLQFFFLLFFFSFE